MLNDIHDPKAWLDAMMENVPEEHQESFGQMQALREYGDRISSLPEKKQEKLWSDFNKALDERFPSRLMPRPDVPETPKPVPRRSTNEEIVESVLTVFHAPGDQSPEFHEKLFNRAMGQVDSALSDESFFKRGLRRRKIAEMIRQWMEENLR